MIMFFLFHPLICLGVCQATVPLAETHTLHFCQFDSFTLIILGVYTCQASNTEGEGSSNPLQLTVSCKFIFSFSQLNPEQNFKHSLSYN